MSKRKAAGAGSAARGSAAPAARGSARRDWEWGHEGCNVDDCDARNTVDEQHFQEPKGWEDSSGSEDEDPHVARERAGTDFVDGLIQSWSSGKMPATELCGHAYRAGRAGVAQAVPFGKPPGAPTGHYKRHLDTALGLNQKNASGYMIQLPATAKACGRLMRETLATPPHESLLAEFVGDPDLQAHRLDPRLWPPAVTEHPVLMQAPPEVRETFVPLAPYVDGVPLTNSDSFLGMSVVNMATGARHLVVLIRKSDICKCGCRGGPSVIS